MKRKISVGRRMWQCVVVAGVFMFGVQPVRAQWDFYGGVSDTELGIENGGERTVAAVNKNTRYRGVVLIPDNWQILGKYVYNGQSWVSPTAVDGVGDPTLVLYLDRVFTSTNDYRMGSGIVYRNTDTGAVGTYTFGSTCARVFNREGGGVSFGSRTLTYIDEEVVVPFEFRGTYTYLGGFYGDASLVGNNTAAATMASWRGVYVNGGWEAGAFNVPAVGYLTMGYVSPAGALPTSYSINLRSAIFAAGQGGGSWGRFTFNNGYVYSRNNQSGGCPALPPLTTPPQCDSTCGAGACGVRTSEGTCVADWGNTIYGLDCCALVCVPPVGGTCQWAAPCPGGDCSYNCYACSTSPTPTPTLAPRVECPLAQSQELGVGSEGLSTTYEYVQFTAAESGYVDRLELKVGNAGGGDRVLTCKVTDSTGSVDISKEKFTAVSGSSVADWRTLVFKDDYYDDDFNLYQGTVYRIYCKSSDDTNNLLWIYNNITNGVAPNGKTYRIYQCPGIPPTYGGLVIKNTAGTVVPAETGNRNHIYDSLLTDRQVRFEVSVTDVDGGNTIDDVRLRFSLGTNYLTARVANLTTSPASSLNQDGAAYSSFFDVVSTTTAGVGRTVVFPIQFNDAFATNTYHMRVYAEDAVGGTLPFTDTNRDFRVWDGKVDVSGSVYDGGAGIVCPSTGFTTLASSAMNFTSLLYDGLGGVADKTMTVTVPATYSSSSGSELMWGSQYTWVFNSDLNASNITARANGTNCPSGSTITVSGTLADPYADAPAVTVDYSAVTIYGQWYQAIGGGIIARTSIVDEVPPTCSGTCQAAMSIGTTTALGVGESNNGIIGAGSVTNPSGCGEACDYGWPSDWRVNRDMLGKTYNYNNLLNNYWAKLGIGRTYQASTTMETIVTDTGGTGVAFVKGDLSIGINNSLINNEFLMVIVKGNITISSSVTRTDGVLVADGNITASGESDSQLKINGMLYAGGSINLERNYVTKLNNNTSPSVVVSYRPDLIFNMPSRLIKTVSIWREGL